MLLNIMLRKFGASDTTGSWNEPTEKGEGGHGDLPKACVTTVCRKSSRRDTKDLVRRQ